jgi:DNA-directed RNA polymerase subunit RPC12/RpoP
MYVMDKHGKRIGCGHPGEFATVRRVLGWRAFFPKIVHKRTGFNSDCRCLDCLKKFNLDVDRDVRVCPHCKSSCVASLREATGKKCPTCKEGRILTSRPVMWT